MALDIGSLVSRIEVNTSSLTRASTEMQKLTGVVQKQTQTIERLMKSMSGSIDTATASTKKQISAQNESVASTKKVEAAMSRQRRATNSARQQMLNLVSSLKKIGASETEVRKVTSAYRTFQRTLGTSAISSRNLARAQDVLRAKFGAVRRTLPSLSGNIQNMSSFMKEMASATVLAIGPLSGLGARFTAFNALTSRSTLLIGGVIAAFIGLSVASASLVKGVITAVLSMEQIEARFIAATGSGLAATRQFNFVARISEKLGLDVRKTASEFSLLAAAIAGSNISAKVAQTLFIGAASASAALKLSAEKSSLIFLALRQIVSKGKVSMEEISRQLGETLPGALRLSAQAMGVTISEFIKLVKTGELLSEDFIPKFAKVMKEEFQEKGLAAADSLQGSINRLQNAFFRFFIAVDQSTGISEKFKAVVKGITSAINFLSANMNDIVAIVKGLTAAMLALLSISLIRNLTSMTGGFIKLGSSIKLATVAMIAFRAANPIGGILTLITVLAAAAIGLFTYKRASEAAAASNDPLIQKADAVIKAYEDMREAQDLNAESALKEVQERGKAIRKDIENQRLALENFRNELTTPIKAPSFGFAAPGAAAKPQQFVNINEVRKQEEAIRALEESLKNLGFRESKLKDVVDATAKALLGEGEAEKMTEKQLKELLKTTDSFTATFTGMQEMLDAVDIKEFERIVAEYEKGMADMIAASDSFTVTFTGMQAMLDTIDIAEFERIVSELSGKTIGGVRAMEVTFSDLASTISSSFTDAIFSAQSFNEVINALARDIAKMYLRMLIFNSLLGLGNKNPVEQITGQASGGPVSSGKSYLVGEEGPEIFSPGTSGSIIPNHKINGSGGTTIIQHIDARGASPGVEFLIANASKRAENRAVSRSISLSRDSRRR